MIMFQNKPKNKGDAYAKNNSGIIPHTHTPFNSKALEKGSIVMFLSLCRWTFPSGPAMREVKTAFPPPRAERGGGILHPLR